MTWWFVHEKAETLACIHTKFCRCEQPGCQLEQLAALSTATPHLTYEHALVAVGCQLLHGCLRILIPVPDVCAFKRA